MRFWDLVTEYREGGLPLRMALVEVYKNHRQIFDAYQAGIETEGQSVKVNIESQGKAEVGDSEEIIALRKTMNAEAERKIENARKVLGAYLDVGVNREMLTAHPEDRPAFEKVVREVLTECRKEGGDFYAMVKGQSGLTREEVDMFLGRA